MINEFNLGKIVIISEKGYAFGRIGIISDPRGISNYAWKNRATNNERIPVMFPGFPAPRWFNCYNIHHATESERKTYFKDILRDEK